MLWQLVFGLGSTPVPVSAGADIASTGLLLGFFKLLFVLVAVMYVAFAVVAVRQVHIMRTTLITSFSPILQTIAYVHLGVAVMVLGLFLLVL